jgi:hypothetical protein
MYLFSENQQQKISIRVTLPELPNLESAGGNTVCRRIKTPSLGLPRRMKTTSACILGLIRTRPPTRTRSATNEANLIRCFVPWVNLLFLRQENIGKKNDPISICTDPGKNAASSRHPKYHERRRFFFHTGFA